MATGNKLEVTIGADVTDFKKKIQEVESDIRDLSKVKLDQLKLGLDTREINAQIKDAKNSLATLKDSVGKTGNAIGGQFTKQTANGGNALMQFSRIAQDAPYGIIGIGNNLTATAEAFSYLKNQTGSTGGALKALASSLMGTGGILLGISLLTTGFTLLSQSGLSVGDVIDKLTGKAESFAKTLSKVNDEAYKDKGVQEAITNVNELTNEIELAKNGFLDKDKVVEHYNETIGKTTGLVSSLDEAEKEITKNGDAYIKMTLYKAAANLALQEAAKASLETERTRLKSLKDFASVTDDLSSSAKSTTGLGDAMSADEYKALQKSRVKAQKQRKDDEIKINTDAAQQNLNIAKKFQDDAAKIAKGFGFNFFGDTKATKEKAAKQDNSSFELEKQRLERIIEINKEILASENTLYYDRLSSQKAFSNATIALIDITKTKELRDSKNTENDKLRITEDAANKTVDTKNKLANRLKGIKLFSNQDFSRGNLFDSFSTNIAPTLPPIALTFKDPTEGFTAWNEKVVAGLTTAEQALLDFNYNAAALISTSIGDTFGQLGTVIGEALVNGGNVLSAIGTTLLQSLGKFLSDMGGMLIQYGTLAVVKGKLDLAILTGGPVAIAAGIAAIGIGVALKAIGGAIGAKAKGGAGGNTSTSTGSGANNTSTTYGGGSFSSSGGGTVVFEIAGTSLIGVLNNTTSRNLRLGGK